MTSVIIFHNTIILWDGSIKSNVQRFKKKSLKTIFLCFFLLLLFLPLNLCLYDFAGQAPHSSIIVRGAVCIAPYKCRARY